MVQMRHQGFNRCFAGHFRDDRRNFVSGFTARYDDLAPVWAGSSSLLRIDERWASCGISPLTGDGTACPDSDPS